MIEDTERVYVGPEAVEKVIDILESLQGKNLSCSEATHDIFKYLSWYLGPQVQLCNLAENIQIWSESRNLNKQDPTKQLVKMQEELGELSQGFLKEKLAQVIDSLGDLLVVIIIFCQQENLEVAEVLQCAWDQIKDRHGKIVDGTYVKDSDLNE
jgi:NTP pyrophosphatase (non-canonical NTP hydrolase)